MIRRIVAAIVAWAVGASLYVAAAYVWSGDPLSLLVQPLVGAALAAVLVALALAIGFLAGRVGPLRRAWRDHPEIAATLVVGCLALMLLGSSFGITSEYADPETNAPFTALHPAAGLGAYAALVFALANWPVGGRAPTKSPAKPKVPDLVEV
jgi:hypothetical protein